MEEQDQALQQEVEELEVVLMEVKELLGVVQQLTPEVVVVEVVEQVQELQEQEDLVDQV